MIQNPAWPVPVKKIVEINGKPVEVFAYLKMTSDLAVSLSDRVGESFPPTKPPDAIVSCPVCGCIRQDSGADTCTYERYLCRYVTYPCGTIAALSAEVIIWYRLSEECARSIGDII